MDSNKNALEFRELSQKEITILKNNGNSSDNWKEIQV